MDEIQNKYALGSFKDRTNKQSKLKFEEIDLEIYRAQARCAAFVTSKERILHWIKSFQFRYYETLKDNDEYLVEWIDGPGYDGFTFQEIEIKIYNMVSQTQDTSYATDDTKLLITIHIYLKSGVIMFQGCAYQL